MRRGLIIFLLLWTVPVRAQIQDALEGPGIKLGEGTVLHPRLGLDTAYDSNVHYEDDSEDPQASPFLRISGHADLASLPPERLGESEPALDWRAGLGFAYRLYLSDDEFPRELDGLDLDADLRATINPEGFVYFKAYDQFIRVVEPANAEGPIVVSQDHNRAGAELGVRPGGGVTTAAVGYELDVKVFEEDRLNAIGADPDLHWHSLKGSGKWKFLPKTAITLDVTYGIYDKDNSVRTGASEPVYEDSTALRGYLGVTGLVTSKISTVAKIGYGRADYDETENLNTVIGKFQVDWRVTLQSKLSMGYERDFADSVNANYYLDDYAYGSYEHLIAGRAVLALKPGVRSREYNGSFRDEVVGGDGDREDLLVELEAGVTYQALPWFLVGGSYRLQTNSTDSGSEAPNSGDNAYVKHVVLLRLEAAY